MNSYSSGKWAKYYLTKFHAFHDEIRCNRLTSWNINRQVVFCKASPSNHGIQRKHAIDSLIHIQEEGGTVVNHDAYRLHRVVAVDSVMEGAKILHSRYPDQKLPSDTHLLFEFLFFYVYVSSFSLPILFSLCYFFLLSFFNPLLC